MRFFSVWVVAFVFFLPVTQNQYFRVVRVLDGDTIEIINDDTSTTTRVRFNGIDAPEKNQAFGQRSKEYLAGWVAGKYVRLQSFGTDRYGRTLADVFLYTDDKVSVNARMVEAGFAWHYKQYSNDSELAKLEQMAKTNKAGLWADPYPLPPWEFRKLKH